MITHNSLSQQEAMETIKPGICSISNEAYHQSPGISRSALMEFRESPLDYWHKYINPDRPPEKRKKHFDFGQAFHTLVLEPEEFDNRFVVVPHLKRNTKVGKKLDDEINLSLNGRGKIIEKLPDGHADSDYQDLIRMVKIMKEEIFTLLGVDLSKAKIEKSIYWIDKDTGILCKARPDIWQGTCILDIKGEVDISPKTFVRSANDKGYHVQMAMIAEELLTLFGVEITRSIFPVVGKKPPYPSGIYSLDKPSIELGRKIFKEELRKYKICLETDHWPSHGVQEISLPRYAFHSEMA